MTAFEDLDYKDRFNLPPLFNIDKKGAERTWIIWSEGSKVTRVQGITDGKMQTYHRDFLPKNVGKKNETSGEEQAKREAERMWVKQLDKGYMPRCKEGKKMLDRIKSVTSESGGHNINATAAIRGREMKDIKVSSSDKLSSPNLELTIIPMKAGVWSLEKKCLKYFEDPQTKKFRCYLQRKLDGWRGIARLQKDGSVVFTSNKGKQYPWFGHLRKEFEELVRGKNILDGLDGEFYTHSIIDDNGNELDEHSRFQTITSMCGLARTSPHPLENQLRFVVFDLVDLSSTYTQEERFDMLVELFRTSKVHKQYAKKQYANNSNSGMDLYRLDCPFRILICETTYTENIEDIPKYHDIFAGEGYEGVMIRSFDMKYLPKKRSLHIRKHKHFEDAEYPIIGTQLNHGVKVENFVWVLYDDVTDTKFSAKPKGTEEERKYSYEHQEDFIGQLLTVKFQGKSEDGIPRFPIGKSIRTQD
jgi:ATP-dependent DNA ligase